MPPLSSWFPPIHPEGHKFVGIAGFIAFLLFWWTGPILGMLGLGLMLWVALFFRDPKRAVPQDPDILVSPADGKISLITQMVPPKELELGDAPLTRVSVFMNVFNCHVNRTPLAGTVKKIVYVPGKFINADLDKASEDNERQLFAVRRDDGIEVGFVQIAGLVARRIVKFVREGERLEAGQRVGLIRFGSRVDVYLPEGMTPAVAVGQTTVAGETVLARRSDAAAPTARTI